MLIKTPTQLLTNREATKIQTFLIAPNKNCMPVMAPVFMYRFIGSTIAHAH